MQGGGAAVVSPPPPAVLPSLEELHQADDRPHQRPDSDDHRPDDLRQLREVEHVSLLLGEQLAALQRSLVPREERVHGLHADRRPDERTLSARSEDDRR